MKGSLFSKKEKGIIAMAFIAMEIETKSERVKLLVSTGREIFGISDLKIISVGIRYREFWRKGLVGVKQLGNRADKERVYESKVFFILSSKKRK